MNTAKLIKTMRENAGLSQKQLASKIDVCYESVRKWEKGDTCPTADALLEVARATGYQVKFVPTKSVMK